MQFIVLFVFILTVAALALLVWRMVFAAQPMPEATATDKKLMWGVVAVDFGVAMFGGTLVGIAIALGATGGLLVYGLVRPGPRQPRLIFGAAVGVVMFAGIGLWVAALA